MTALRGDDRRAGDDAHLGYTIAALADDFLAWWVDREDNDGESVEQDEAYEWWVAKAREMGAKL